MGWLGERRYSWGWAGVFCSLPWAPAAWELSTAWWSWRYNIDVGRNYCQVRALRGCHMYNKQVVSAATCFINFCFTGKSVKIDNTPWGFCFLVTYTWNIYFPGKTKSRTLFSTCKWKRLLRQACVRQDTHSASTVLDEILGGPAMRGVPKGEEDA